MRKRLNNSSKITIYTEKESKVKPDFVFVNKLIHDDITKVDYVDLNGKHCQFEVANHSFLINSFKQIGWPDPFPNDNLPKNPHLEKYDSYVSDADELVYPQSRSNKDFIPLMIYIPRKELMWKMMRACIGVTDEKELWFNRTINIDRT